MKTKVQLNLTKLKVLASPTAQTVHGGGTADCGGGHNRPA